MTRVSRRRNWPGFATIRFREDNSPLPNGYIRMLLGRPSLWAVGMANFGLDFINFMFLTWYPTYLTDKYHMSLGRMGIMAMEPYIFAMITVLGAGRLVRALTDGGMDSVSARRMVIFGGLLIGTALPGRYRECLEPVCIGYGHVAGLCVCDVDTGTDVVDTRRRSRAPRGVGFAAGFVNFVGNVGGIGSPILMGVVFQHFNSFTPAILISAGITMACAVLFILLYRAKADKEFVAAFLAS